MIVAKNATESDPNHLKRLFCICADLEKPKPKGRNCVAYSKEDSHTGHNWVSASSASRQPLLPRPLVLALLALLALQSVPNWHRGAK